ncbi:hypothetical protein [Paenibacillus woosongensis]|uniref:Uncharacterized protein n=1 Tax=Paenibacillus woosongensis TaxID=307580 RepID=A0ABQ4MYZ4_9BACL|nr:hypothetical protein [Paenibacillus woosongensis]GIP61143.1 hypothetical protein J15TS10_49570 [Paenibacillus woosongensis]
MIKRFGAWLLALCLFFVPTFVFAEENPIEKLEKNMKLNWKVLDGLDFIFSPFNLLLTLLLIGIFLFCVWKILAKLWKVVLSKETLKDKMFWLEVGGVILILFLFLSGAFWKFLGGLYNWTEKQDVTGVTSSAVVRDIGSFL